MILHFEVLSFVWEEAVSGVQMRDVPPVAWRTVGHFGVRVAPRLDFEVADS